MYSLFICLCPIRRVQTATDSIQKLDIFQSDNHNAATIKSEGNDSDSDDDDDNDDQNGIDLLLEAAAQISNEEHTENTDTTFDCNQCKETFSKSVQLKRHIVSTHGALKQFECLRCHKRFNSQNGLNSHSGKAHKKENKIKQNKSRKKNKLNLTKTKKEKDDSPSPEDEDGSSSSLTSSSSSRSRSRSRSRWRRHKMDDTDNDNEEEMDSDTMREMVENMDGNNLECPQCHKRFTSSKRKSGRAKLRKHLVVHSTKRPFKCKWCQNTYKRKESLAYHQRRNCAQREQQNNNQNVNKKEMGLDGDAMDIDKESTDIEQVNETLI